MTADALSSNVLNYLIWRYLQEAGFGNAAIQLSKAWHRDPQSLPFAERVERRQLINIVQDGLSLDQLQARVKKSERRYVFGADHGPRYSVQSGDPEPEVLPYGTALHPQTTTVPQTARAPETDASVPPETTSRKTPGGRKRKGTVSKEHRPPADAMEIDTNGASTLSIVPAEEAVVSEVPSPVVEEPPLPPPTPPIPLEVESKSTGTDAAHKLTPEAVITTVRRRHPDVPVQVHQAAFSPAEPNALLLTGDNLAQIWIIPYNIPTNLPFEPLYLDFSNLVSQFRVMACVWTHPLQTVVMALWETFRNERGESMSRGRLVHMTRTNDGFNPRTLASSIKEVVDLSWNPSTQSLLCLSISERGGLLRLWKDALEFKVSGVTVGHSHAVEWTADKEFVLCGEGAVWIYEILHANDIGRAITVKKRFETPGITWHKMVFDPVTKLLAVASIDSHMLAILDLKAQQSSASEDFGGMHTLPVFNCPTEITFQPIPNPASLADDAPRLLACASESGEVMVYDARKPWTQLARLRLGMGKSAEACTWSGDGFLLAAAGGGRAVVWRAEDILAAPRNNGDVPARVVWMAGDGGKWAKGEANSVPQKEHASLVNGDAAPNGHTEDEKGIETNGLSAVNGAGHGEDMDVDRIDYAEGGDAANAGQNEHPSRITKQNLVWDHDGKKLIYTAGDQIAIIKLAS